MSCKKTKNFALNVPETYFTFFSVIKKADVVKVMEKVHQIEAENPRFMREGRAGGWRAELSPSQETEF
jgi:hypothetical protein